MLALALAAPDVDPGGFVTVTPETSETVGVATVVPRSVFASANFVAKSVGSFLNAIAPASALDLSAGVTFVVTVMVAARRAADDEIEQPSFA